MKITLAFTIFNKEEWVGSLLKSWISRLSGKNEYEVIIVFDACKDKSEKIAKKYLKKTGIKYKFFQADDKFEIYCNNFALKHATGDYIIFIQDDNWMYDMDWDEILRKVVEGIPNLGAIGFLAGLKFIRRRRLISKFENNKYFCNLKSILLKRPFKKKMIEYERVEIYRSHKKNYFNFKNNKKYRMGIWKVDAICRPFMISTNLLRSFNGLNQKFMPTCGDDLDLSIRLLKKGRMNIYVPFDLLNTTASNKTLSKYFIDSVYHKALSMNYRLHSRFLNKYKSDVRYFIAFP